MQLRYALGVVVMFMLALTACGGQVTPEQASAAATTAPATSVPATAAPTAAAETPATDTAIIEATTAVPEATASEPMTESAPAEAVEAPIVEDRPAWQLLPLTNSQTGESFTLADFAGKTVYVEPFATWCTNCRQQLNYVNQARANFGDEVVFIALSVEPNIGDEALAQYATEEGFGLIFAAMSPDLLRELVALHGQTITNPPATPHFVIRADGSTTELSTGIEGPEAITLLIQAAQG